MFASGVLVFLLALPVPVVFATQSFDPALEAVTWVSVLTVATGLVLLMVRRYRAVGVGLLLGTAVALVCFFVFLVSLPFLWTLFGYSD